MRVGGAQQDVLMSVKRTKMSLQTIYNLYTLYDENKCMRVSHYFLFNELSNHGGVHHDYCDQIAIFVVGDDERSGVQARVNARRLLRLLGVAQLK